MQAFRIIGLSVLGAVVVGCYTLQPIPSAVPEAGTVIALDINDAGRLALGGSMGPEIAQIEGRLLSTSDAGYHVAVSTLHLLHGGQQPWSGEDVRVQREHVSTIRERRLSRGRTIALSVIGAGAIAFFVTRSITGGGTESPGKTPTDTAQTQLIPQP
jgi:hypothetical protein